MSVPKYTSEAKLENYLDKTIVTGAADDAMLSAEKYIDEYTGRNFLADSVATERTYCGKGNAELIIDDCVEVTALEIGTNFWGDAFVTITPFVQGVNAIGYITMPVNAVAEKVPIRKLISRNRNFILGLNNIKVTAKWGWSAVVIADIVYAATVISAGFYQYGRSGSVGGVKSENIGEYSISYKNEDGWSDLDKAQKILDRYKKVLF